jgi:DNA processing protein
MRQIRFDEFPPLLQQVPDAPERLYIRGNLPSENTDTLAVVGSRKMSAYGKRVCESLVGDLAGYPLSIVSGLALGIDSTAHEAALRAGLHTIAVMPSGLSDRALYPAIHRPLAKKILEAGGALISEYEPDDEPKRWTFSERNRIMAGLSKAVVVIEAAEKSGSLITARLALDYNRDVLAVPHPIGSETGMGGNRYIREGATLIRSAHDILESLGFSQEPEQTQLVDLSEDERMVYETLAEGCERGDLMDRTNLPQSRINIALSLLLIKGLVREELGKVVRT